MDKSPCYRNLIDLDHAFKYLYNYICTYMNMLLETTPKYNPIKYIPPAGCGQNEGVYRQMVICAMLHSSAI